MSDETAAALHEEARKYEQAALSQTLRPEHQPALEAVAQAHVEASRPLDEILAEYVPLLEQHSAGELTDYTRFSELMNELQPVRLATAILNGAPPGTAPVIVAEQNEPEGEDA